MDYLSRLNEKIKVYFEVLEPEFPKWLKEYIEVPALMRSASISNNCGMVYTNLDSSNFFYSNLDHSVAVALVVWHFTHDKKQTLAGLFHDIATPAFKHCIDVMNGDNVKQESLELLTTKFIKDSSEIMNLLKRDNIKLEEVDDLSKKKESEIVAIIENSKYSEIFKSWRETRKVEVSSIKPKDVYWVKSESKIRFIDPLLNGERISRVCKITNNYIAKIYHIKWTDIYIFQT